MVSRSCAGGGNDDDEDTEPVGINADDLEEDKAEKLKSSFWAK